MKYLFLAVVVALSIFMVARAFDSHERAARHHHLSSIRVEAPGQHGSGTSIRGGRGRGDAAAVIGDEPAY